MTDKQKKEIIAKVYDILENKIQDIYIELQNNLGIKYGDNPIDYAMPEIVATKNLAKAISETLIWQKEQEEKMVKQNKTESVEINTLFAICNEIKETTNRLSNEDFMVCICMLIDEHRKNHRSGLTATEIAKRIYENVKVVNEELGEY